MGAILLDEQTAPGTPSMGQVVIYPKSDGELYKKDDTGTEAALSVSSATDTTEGIVELATQAEQEAGTDATRAVTPGRQHFHPSAAKAWVNWNYPAGTATILASHGVSSLTDVATGRVLINFATAFSSANYGYASCGRSSSTGNTQFVGDPNTAKTAGALAIMTLASDASADITEAAVAAYGDI